MKGKITVRGGESSQEEDQLPESTSTLLQAAIKSEQVAANRSPIVDFKTVFDKMRPEDIKNRSHLLEDDVPKNIQDPIQDQSQIEIEEENFFAEQRQNTKRPMRNTSSGGSIENQEGTTTSRRRN